MICMTNPEEAFLPATGIMGGNDRKRHASRRALRDFGRLMRSATKSKKALYLAEEERPEIKPSVARRKRRRLTPSDRYRRG